MKSFRDYNPAALLVYYICVLAPVMFCLNPVLVSMALISGAFSLAAVNDFSALKKQLWVLAVPAAGMILNTLFNHNGASVLFVMNDSPVTGESALYGLFAGIMIAAVLLWFAGFSQVMTSDKLLYVFGTVSPKTALILSMTLRYIPLFRKQTVRTNQAQKAMGLYGDDSTADRIKGGLQVFSVMTTWALENGVITADSMEARGYGTGRRSRFALFRWTPADTLLTAVSAGLSAVTCVCEASGALTCVWFPRFAPAELTRLTAFAYLCYGVLSLLPCYLRIKEEIKWNCLQSGI